MSNESYFTKMKHAYFICNEQGDLRIPLPSDEELWEKYKNHQEYYALSKSFDLLHDKLSNADQALNQFLQKWSSEEAKRPKLKELLIVLHLLKSPPIPFWIEGIQNIELFNFLLKNDQEHYKPSKKKGGPKPHLIRNWLIYSISENFLTSNNRVQWKEFENNAIEILQLFGIEKTNSVNRTHLRQYRNEHLKLCEDHKFMPHIGYSHPEGQSPYLMPFSKK